MERVHIFGAGRMGLALGQALAEVEAVERLVFCGRTPDPPVHPLFLTGVAEWVYGLDRPPPDTTAVFLTVPESDLPEMAWALGGQGPVGAPVPAFHTSLGLSTEVLAPLHAQGYTVGSFHPLVRLDRSPEAGRRLLGAPILVSGERGAAAAGRRIAQLLGGRVLELPVTRRPAASAAEALILRAAGAVARLGRDLLIEAGIDPDDADVAARSLASTAFRSAPEGWGGETDPEHPYDPAARITSEGVDPQHEDVDLHLRALPEEARDLYRRLLGFGQETRT